MTSKYKRHKQTRHRKRPVRRYKYGGKRGGRQRGGFWYASPGLKAYFRYREQLKRRQGKR